MPGVVGGHGVVRRRELRAVVRRPPSLAPHGIPRGEVNSRVDELLEFVQLTDKARSRVEDLSGGMKRRLTIARSLVNRPELLLLDEPTTGLDPQARHVLWDQLFRLKQAGVTLVITTHYMDEAEQLCDLSLIHI